jgi:hypothetical protein
MPGFATKARGVAPEMSGPAGRALASLSRTEAAAARSLE